MWTSHIFLIVLPFTSHNERPSWLAGAQEAVGAAKQMPGSGLSKRLNYTVQEPEDNHHGVEQTAARQQQCMLHMTASMAVVTDTFVSVTVTPFKDGQVPEFKAVLPESECSMLPCAHLLAILMNCGGNCIAAALLLCIRVLSSGRLPLHGCCHQADCHVVLSKGGQYC